MLPAVHICFHSSSLIRSLNVSARGVKLSLYSSRRVRKYWTALRQSIDGPSLHTHAHFSFESCHLDALIPSRVCQGQIALSWWCGQLWDFSGNISSPAGKERGKKCPLSYSGASVYLLTSGYLNKLCAGEEGAWILISCCCGKVNERGAGRKAERVLHHRPFMTVPP